MPKASCLHSRYSTGPNRTVLYWFSYFELLMQGDGGSPSGVALIAGAGIPSDAGSPQQGIHPGATLRHPPVQGASLQMTPQVSLLPSF